MTCSVCSDGLDLEVESTCMRAHNGRATVWACGLIADQVGDSSGEDNPDRIWRLTQHRLRRNECPRAIGDSGHGK